MGGGGNWEFELYNNNRTNSFTEDGILYLQPTLTADYLGEAGVKTGSMNLWGGAPADQCTSNAFYGCERNAAGSGNYINPITSARIRTVNSFSFKYGRV
jgi:beta-glucanase (GH16 family)